MEATLFKHLAQRIAATMPDVKQVELYTGQYLYPATDANPVFPPAIFVEFGEIMWDDLGERSQQAIVPVRLHVVTQHLPPFGMDRKPAAIAAYAEAVTKVSTRLHQALHGYTPASEHAFAFNTITRRRSARAEAPPTLHVTISEFALLVNDASAEIQYNAPPEPPKLDLEKIME